MSDRQLKACQRDNGQLLINFVDINPEGTTYPSDGHRPSTMNLGTQTMNG